MRSLLRAAADGNAEGVREHVAQGADVNARAERGQTPLMLAAVFGHLDVVNLLLEAGADLTLKDELGLTAMQWSVRRGFPEVTQLLLQTSPAPTEANHVIEAPDDDHLSGAPIEEVSIENNTPAGEPEIFEAAEPFAYREHSDQRVSSLGAAAAAMLRARAAQREHDEINEPETNAVAEESEVSFESQKPESSTTSEQVATSTEIQTENAAASEVAESASISSWVAVVQPDDAAVGIPALADASAELNPLELPADETIERPRTITSSAYILVEDDILQTRDSDSLSADTTQPTLASSSVGNPVPSRLSWDEVDSSEKPPHTSLKIPLDNATTGHTSGRPLLWLLVALTLGGSAWAAYFMSSRLFSARETQSTPVAVASTAPVVTAPKKITPLVGGDLAGAELVVPDVEYPESAQGVSGMVTVDVQVNRKGKVVSAKAVDGDRKLRATAVRAARKATFVAEKLPSDSRIVRGTITYQFRQPEAANTPSDSPKTSETANPAAEDPAQPLTGDALAGKELNLPKADYPKQARARGITGTIIVTVRVNRFGKVISWRTSEGDSRLRAAALKAAKRATFDPQKLPGNGEVVGTITYRFGG